MWLAISTGILLVTLLNSLRLGSSTLAFFRGHTLGKQTARHRVNTMSWWFIVGTVFITWLLLSSLSLLNYLILESVSSEFYWIVIIAILGLELMIMAIVYSYNKKPVHPWISDNFRQYLLTRSQKTKSTAEAMMLGMATIIGQLPIVIGSLLAFCLALTTTFQPENYYLMSLITLASFVGGLSLLIIALQSITNRPVTQTVKFNQRFHRFLNLMVLLIIGTLIIVLAINLNSLPELML